MLLLSIRALIQVCDCTVCPEQILQPICPFRRPFYAHMRILDGTLPRHSVHSAPVNLFANMRILDGTLSLQSVHCDL